ncbi:aminoacyltransferase [Streptococcus cuniculipharyngis]|uniref:Aminoacyltransferase FemA n=1 Tax=Streptococcus cuniculipharyngis TaxID=1562651 RepID=A0A5C5SFZ0_9STRE|nr:aminoacyltransferase [Streptococcus cuniculipharyngis]TWS99058.1 aminoacyltransferase [Streptococcus cuniculipharyngis]
MTLTTLTQEQFLNHISQVKEKSFLQSPEMATLLTKRGYQVSFIGLEKEGQISVSALLYTLPMTGGLHMEINGGPVTENLDHLGEFYQELQTYAKKNGALELIIKPSQTYQYFDSEGNPTSPEQPKLIETLTHLGYQHDGLKTGYPGGEPDWHYVKDLSQLTPEQLIPSFSKKGRPLIKKVKTFGIKIRPLERHELHIFKDITASTSDRRDYSDKSLDYYQDFYDSFGANCEFMVASLNFQDYLNNLQLEYQTLDDKINQVEQDLAVNPDSAKKKKERQQLVKQAETLITRQEEAQDFISKYGQDDVILAGSLFIYTPQESVYLFSGSYTEFNKFYAPAVLQEYVMLESLKRGIPFYNFLGITGQFDHSDGVLRFKQNFNGYIVRKMGTFRYYPKPLKHKTIQLIKALLNRK